MTLDARKIELDATTPAILRGIALRRGRAFRMPRTAAERRELIAWILEAERPFAPQLRA